MRFSETEIPGAYILDIEPHEDDRGWFARAFCADELAAHGLRREVVQSNMSFTRQRGAVRGMHYQLAPMTETKLVRCLRGGIHDVIVDLRPGSPTFRRHVAVELTADNHRALYVPAEFAHGFQTLTDNVEVFYEVSERYAPGYERGLRHDDPALGIAWPLPVSQISAKDASWPLLGLGAEVPA